jgi:hypothetical protein
VSGVVSLGGSEVVAIAEGQVEHADGGGGAQAAQNDRAYIVDIASGRQHELFEAGGPYKIGSGAFNARRRLLLIPDASTDDRGRPNAGVRVFERAADGTFEARDVIVVHSILPPRQVRPL